MNCRILGMSALQQTYLGDGFVVDVNVFSYLLSDVRVDPKSWSGSLQLLYLVARYQGTISVEQPMIILLSLRDSRDPSDLGPDGRETVRSTLQLDKMFCSAYVGYPIHQINTAHIHAIAR